ncbi:MAG TPA: PaaI family thioesterase [Solirubrobacterales bacterium]|nr:PaaI family thioesterase [Solirubrobacterales bacterium]
MTEDAPAPSSAPPRNLNEALGMEIGEFDDERITGSFQVADRVRQPFGIVHGGAYAAFAETLASVGTYFAVQANGEIAMGQNNDTSFLRPISSGTVHATGTRRHRGRTTWVWDFDFTDDEGRVCAISRVTIAVRPAPPSSA